MIERLFRDKIKIPEHRFPLEKVIVSASHNVYENQAEVDVDKVDGLSYYLKRGLVPSYKFARTLDNIVDGFDENKALFPILGKVPLFIPQTIAAIESGMYVAVVGSRGVGKMVKHLKEYYEIIGRAEKADRLKWAPELEGLDNFSYDEAVLLNKGRKEMTLGNSISMGAQKLNLSLDEAFIFSSGDTLFYDFLSLANDRDAINNSIVIDFNAQERINPAFPRNYYHILDLDGERVHIKEPNVWILGAELDPSVASASYADREKGGFGLKTFAKLVGMNMLKHPYLVDVRDMWILGTVGFQEGSAWLLSKLFGGPPKKFKIVVSRDGGEHLGSFVNMSPIKIKAEHDDWRRLKDVDAIHDYVFIRRVMEHYNVVFPEKIARNIGGFREYLDRIGNVGVKTIDNFEDRISERIRKINALLFVRNISHILDDMFDKNGEFVAYPAPAENVIATIERSEIDRIGFCIKYADKIKGLIF